MLSSKSVFIMVVLRMVIFDVITVLIKNDPMCTVKFIRTKIPSLAVSCEVILASHAVAGSNVLSIHHVAWF